MIRSSFVSMLVLAVLLAGCAPATRQDQSAADRLPELLPPQVSLSGERARIDSFNPPGTGASVLVTVPVTITNPNGFPIEVHSVEFSQRLAGSSDQVGPRGLMNVLLPAASSRDFELRLSRSLRQDAELLTRIAQSFAGSSLTFDIEGTVAYSSQMHPWNTQEGFSLGGTAVAQTGVMTPELVVNVSESTIFHLAGSPAVVRVVVNIHNPGTVGYLVHARELIVELAGEPVASQDLPPTPVAAGETTVVAVNFATTTGLLNRQARAVLSDALTGVPVELLVRGRVVWDVLGLDSFRQPDEMQLRAVLNGN